MSIGIPRNESEIRRAEVANAPKKYPPAPQKRWASSKPVETGNNFAGRERLRAEEEAKIILSGQGR